MKGKGQRLKAKGSSERADQLFSIEYRCQLGRHWRTAVEAQDVVAAKDQFRRDNPHFELVAATLQPSAFSLQP